MFGYVIINKPELKIKDYDLYHSFYCGLCHSLGKQSGPGAQLTLSYEMTFLALLLFSLYDEKEVICRLRCPLRPWKKECRRSTRYTDYAADMNVLLAYYDLMDDWQDEKKARSLMTAKALEKPLKRIKKQWPRQAAAVEDYVRELSRCEKALPGRSDKESSKIKEEGGAAGDIHPLDPNLAKDIDYAAGLTGKMLAEIFVPEEDMWSQRLRRMGFFLGKFIYLMDAYEDLPKDLMDASYNPWRYYRAAGNFDDEVMQILTMMVSECASAFEELPLLDYTDILRNILYSGLWTRHAKVRESRQKSEEASS